MSDQEQVDQPEDQQHADDLLDDEDFEEDGSDFGFWATIAAVILLAIVGGIALGVYVIPAGSLPGDEDYQAQLERAYSELDQLDAQTRAQANLEASVSQTLATASSETEDTDLVLQNAAPALVYTVYATEMSSCADFVGIEVGGQVRSFSLSEPYPC